MRQDPFIAAAFGVTDIPPGYPWARAINEIAARAEASKREDRVKEIARAFLPYHLGWLVEHPRLLALYYRMRPSKRPLDSEVTASLNLDAALTHARLTDVR